MQWQGMIVTQSLRQYALPHTHKMPSKTPWSRTLSGWFQTTTPSMQIESPEDTIGWTKVEETSQLKCMDQTSLKITFDLITCGCTTLCGTSSCMCAIDGFICIPAHKDNLMEKQINGCYTRMLRIVWMETIIPQYGSLPTQNPTKKDENGLSLDKAQRRNC